MNSADPDAVIATVRRWLGTPYHDQASLRGVGCDCLGLARGVWRDLVGVEPQAIPPYSRDWGETGVREVLAEGARAMMIGISIADTCPGALVLFRMAPRAIAKHVGILAGTGIGRIWADGKPMDMTGVTWRWYPGSETQGADPFIAAKMGAISTLAYRGLAYVVFENLALTAFGNRIPQLSFKIFAPLTDADTPENMVRAVTMIPASGEFAYATSVVKKTDAGSSSAVNVNAASDTPDIEVSLDRLEAMAPAVASVSLVVAWFGNDLRAGNCTVRPKVEVAAKTTVPGWSVNGVARAAALVISQIDGKPVYGGTPADFSVAQANQAIKARGLRVGYGCRHGSRPGTGHRHTDRR